MMIVPPWTCPIVSTAFHLVGGGGRIVSASETLVLQLFKGLSLSRLLRLRLLIKDLLWVVGCGCRILWSYQWCYVH
jgi:hypothetical protein